MATVSSVYAKAIFQFAKEKGQLDQVASELAAFWETCRSNEALSSVLTGAGINPNDRNAISRSTVSAMGLAPLSARFIELLSVRGRLSEMPQILRQLEAMIESAKGVQAGEVRAAVELSAEELAVLSSSIAKRIGGKVRLSQVVDSTLLGGMVATVAGKTFDASLKSQIERFKSELI
jgi:F-type H+-transporting ATPase subunit delta